MGTRFSKLFYVYETDTWSLETIDAPSDVNIKITEALVVFDDTLSHLAKFCGGIVSCCSNTSSIKSDLYVIA